MRLTVRVTPNAKYSQVLGLKHGVLHAKLHAKPHDGDANEELIRLLAIHYSIPKTSIKLLKGLHSRSKIVELPLHTLSNTLET